MDPDRLRLILLFIGMAVVVAIYLWDRYKRSRQKLKGLTLRQARKIRKQYGLDDMKEKDYLPSFTAVEKPRELEGEVVPLHGARPSRGRSREPVLSGVPDPEPEPEFRLEPETMVAAQPEPEPEAEPESPARAEAREKPPRAPGQEDYLHRDPALLEELPQMVLQIGVVKRDGAFSGTDILSALEKVGLRAGAMSIFHRYDHDFPDRVLFSVANLFKPGDFPFDAMEDFSTPGLLFFTQLPGVRDGLEIYTEMLEVASQVAETLGGVLQDENRSALSRQSIQHTRDLIAEHRRKLDLAQKKWRHANGAG